MNPITNQTLHTNDAIVDVLPSARFGKITLVRSSWNSSTSLVRSSEVIEDNLGLGVSKGCRSARTFRDVVVRGVCANRVNKVVLIISITEYDSDSNLPVLELSVLLLLNVLIDRGIIIEKADETFVCVFWNEVYAWIFGEDEPREGFSTLPSTGHIFRHWSKCKLPVLTILASILPDIIASTSITFQERVLVVEVLRDLEWPLSVLIVEVVAGGIAESFRTQTDQIIRHGKWNDRVLLDRKILWNYLRLEVLVARQSSFDTNQNTNESDRQENLKNLK